MAFQKSAVTAMSARHCSAFSGEGSSTGRFSRILAACHSTSHTDPIYTEEGIIHYAVDNIPSGFSCTASQTLSAATLPHALAIAEKGVEQALLDDKHLRRGLTTYQGKLCLLETALKHNLPFTDPKDAIEGK